MDPRLPGIASVDGELHARLLEEVERHGPTYRPRTNHLAADGRPTFVNRLVRETSPYLLQHAHNPVNWFAWGEEAFSRAAAEDKLVLLSIGYSTCHWCHVMERESFEDEEIAGVINANFIPVKVDREERPDVDAIYMTTVQMMTGHGGWPMTVFMLPDARPVMAGTYFPARDGDRGARVGFLSLLREMARRYRAERETFVEHAATVVHYLRRANESVEATDVPGVEALRTTVDSYLERFDPQWGGWGGPPKFPRSAVLELLMREYTRSGDPDVLTMVTTTLEKMASGGLHDQVGGGFHRYSVDQFWLVPHFEKMLYDNAQLAVSYLDGYRLTGRSDFALVARRTLDYVAREMLHEAGGFFSATDADSLTPSGESEEGWFFTWTQDELREVLGEEGARLVAAVFAVRERGNFEGRSVLWTPRPLAEVAQELGVPAPLVAAALAGALPLLYETRRRRPAPLRDEKIVTAWNGLMISAFAQGGFVLGEPRYSELARRAAEFVLISVAQGGRLSRTWRDGRAKHAGVLDDYAFVLQGLLDLYEATGEERWLGEARRLQATLDAEFWDAHGQGYWFTANDAEALLIREKPDQDGAEPAGNSVAMMNLVRLAELTGEAAYRQRAGQGLSAFGERLAQVGVTLPKMLCALDVYLGPTAQVAVVGRDVEAMRPLLDVLRGRYLPRAVVVPAVRGAASSSPLLAGRLSGEEAAVAYVCRDLACELPAKDPETLAAQLMTFDRAG